MTLPVPDSQVPSAEATRVDGSDPAGTCEATSETPFDPARASGVRQDARASRAQQAAGASGSRAAGLLGSTEVRGLSQALGIRPTKTLGQNFVHDAGTVRRIVRSAGVRPDDTVLEIGPGLGSLTLALLETGARVSAVEIDPVLARALPVTVADRMPEAAGRLGVIEADALSITGAEALSGAEQTPPTRLVANLPYNVAVPVLLTVLEALPSLETVTVMVQAEVADRLAAAPGSRTYGVPSVKAAWYAAARRTLTISRHVFWPVPNVDSALVELVRRRPPTTRATREQVFAVVDAAFAQRRKTLRKALAKAAGGVDTAEAALRATGIDPTRRGETLDITAFAALAEALHPIDADGAAASTPPTTSQEQS
ncbi:16S rRNA (adenine(1518)-N(6)/adenine(1519)-N(6))-dimethyltransferase RsmA [uncultured Actinomyces sp.]|uniref:16S rRNA (adenine(1518)-N(6)/adenine(1519)-N(6))- dimethyltransferase RsmA n=1 Tax=uncultured Actinomyces sp. TaxID=249061 RepID=UPI0025DB2740|nr:16S rRNA (adenine(1518)-N(6)/adenine(1519)-N(6))-dimethyltransferase RsmA [uncultured Actinomyces sp.]